MRVYHFVPADYGLQDIEKRHLKIALLDELNDPFEWLAAETSDKDKRRAIQKTKDEQARVRGLLCFSLDWRNPVMWSHYSDRHRGLCLGFDVDDKYCHIIEYRAQRLSSDWMGGALSAEEKERHMKQFLYTKFSHWKYEKEVRIFVDLKGAYVPIRLSQTPARCSVAP